jgi:hypothetical protein
VAGLPGQLSGMFLATTVNLRVTGLPGTAKKPPPAAMDISPPADALPVTRLWLRSSVPSRLKMPPPGPDVFPR